MIDLVNFIRITERLDKMQIAIDQAKKTSPNETIPKAQIMQIQRIDSAMSQLSQRLDDIDNRFKEFVQAAEMEMLEEEKQNEIKSITKTDNKPTENQPKPLRFAKSGVDKSTVDKHEYLLNDLNIKMSQLEANLFKLEPNNIKELITGIAALLLKDEKKDISAEMNKIKGSQRQHRDLVDGLQEELKKLNERFTQDIGKKIEKRDLYIAKNQLRKQVLNLTITIK